MGLDCCCSWGTTHALLTSRGIEPWRIMDCGHFDIAALLSGRLHEPYQKIAETKLFAVK